MPTCYVVMPYGGDSPGLQKKYEAVFRAIIMDAAKMAGFKEEEVIREDHSGDAGAITRNIVNHIKEADIVIADLTGMNANVHYELGIAHVFHKSSTVLICEKHSDRAFDIQHLQIIEYSTEIEEFSSSKEKICEAIKKRLSRKTPSDSPVHETIPSLPDHLTDWINADDDAQKKHIAELEQENDKLKKQLVRMGIQVGEPEKKRMTAADLVRMGKAALAFSGTTAVDKVKQLAESNEYDELLDYLLEVTQHGRITNKDAMNILELCEQTENIVVIECATQIVSDLFPNDMTFKTKLARVLAKQPNRREEAIELINSALGLKKDENGDYVEVDVTKVTHNNLARFFDTYLELELYDELVKASGFLLENGGQLEAEMIRRNTFSALTRAHRFDEAEALLPMIEEQGTSIAYYLIATYYDQKGDPKKAYLYYEKSLINDPADDDYARLLAIHILDEKIIRKGDSIVSVSASEAQKAAAALLFYAVQIANNQKKLSKVQNVVFIMQREQNGLKTYLDSVIGYVRGTVEELPYEDVDTSVLDYCLSQADEQ